MIGAGVDGDGKRQGCLDCDDGESQACVVGLEEGDDALVLLPLNHPPALSHLEWIMAAIVHMPFGALAAFLLSTLQPPCKCWNMKACKCSEEMIYITFKIISLCVTSLIMDMKYPLCF